ncbi:hypothetical protein V6N11_001355 [Hibiscus sabdariffa]|uniref:Uncharacterized protein n=1 Tax=Hibiscus sabdariffa TaxID=183260 RepID=A0ABR2S0A8_9ROSI
MTIDDIDKTKKEDSLDSGDLIDVNLVPLDPSPNPIQDDVHGDVNDDQQDICGFDAPIDDVVTDQQQAPIALPTIPLWRSFRDRRSSVRLDIFGFFPNNTSLADIKFNSIPSSRSRPNQNTWGYVCPGLKGMELG